MFSSRLNWDLRANLLSVLLDQQRAAGAPILDLTESNPTRAGFDYPAEEILAALADPAALRYHPSPRGLLSAREAIASQCDGPLDCPALFAANPAIAPDQILLTASTSEAYAYLFKLLCDPGDAILTPRPSYPLFEFLAALESVRVNQYPLRYDGAWHVDFSALESSITARTRAIVVVDPNNPTGSFLQAEEFDRLQSLAAAHGIAVMIDEVFLDYRLKLPARPDHQRARAMALPVARGDETARRRPPSAEPRPKGAADTEAPQSVLLSRERLQPDHPPQALTFHMSGLSKIAGLPQMKLGWIVAEGPSHALALDRLELIADTYLSVSTPVQLALPKLLGLAPQIRDQVRRRTRENLAYLRSLAAGSACQVLNVEGGWYATLQVPRTRGEESWALTLLGDRDVLIQPGFFFDFESEAFLVLSLITPPEIFAEGARRIVSLAR